MRNWSHRRWKGTKRRTAAHRQRSHVQKRSGNRRQQSGTWRNFALVWVGAALLGTAYGGGWISLPSTKGEAVPTSSGVPEVRASFGLCHTGGGYNCVVDGDTIWLEGQNIRIADIDAPETHEPRCPEEKAMGEQATLKLQSLLNGGTVTLRKIDRHEDSYGRKLRLVEVDGESVGDLLVNEGVARWYAGGRRPWC